MAANPSNIEINFPLNLPDIEPVEFEKNFIKTAVCELRFPTLLKYEKEQPVQLQHELRKEYPLYDAQQSVNVSVGSRVVNENNYVFQSRKKDWTVSFKAYSISLQTDKYSGFNEFSSRLEDLLNKSGSLLDTDFFTRVGLRYINEIPIDDPGIEGWINNDLIGPWAKGVYGTVQNFIQEVRGYLKKGNYTFRHGAPRMDEKGRLIYQLDFDFYDEDVPFDSVLSLVSEFNIQGYRFFRWAIGPKGLEKMGKTRPKEKR